MKYPRQIRPFLDRILIVGLCVGLCLVSACARYPGFEEEDPVGCWPCEYQHEKWYWDADEDGEPDFEVVVWGHAPLCVGCSPSSYTMTIRSIYEDRRVHPTNLLYPLEQGQWISANTEWNQYSGVPLGITKCGEFDLWEGPFTEPEGDVFAFRIEGYDKPRVGVARFQMSKCDGYIDILSLRIESELYGIIVGE